MFTVCPKCALTLVVTAQDLRVAQGYVRCGRCSNVFNAIVGLTDDRGALAQAGLQGTATTSIIRKAPSISEDEPAAQDTLTDTGESEAVYAEPDANEAKFQEVFAEPPPQTRSTARTPAPTPAPTPETRAPGAISFVAPPPGPPVKGPAPTTATQTQKALDAEKRYSDTEGIDTFSETELEFNPDLTDVTKVFVEAAPVTYKGDATGKFRKFVMGEEQRDPTVTPASNAPSAPVGTRSPAGTSTPAQARGNSAAPDAKSMRAGAQAPANSNATGTYATAGTGSAATSNGAASGAKAGSTARSGASASQAPAGRAPSAAVPPPSPPRRDDEDLEIDDDLRSLAARLDGTANRPAPKFPAAAANDEALENAADEEGGGLGDIYAKAVPRPRPPPPPQPAPPGRATSARPTQRNTYADDNEDFSAAAEDGDAEMQAGDSAIDTFTPAGPPRPRFMWWVAGAAVLSIVLVGQAIHHNRHSLATNALLNRPLTKFYKAIGVTLVPNWDLRSYDVRQLGASTSESGDGTLTVRASLKNNSSQPLPLPLLRITMQDRYGNRIATRDVAPGGYAPGAVPAEAHLGVGQRIDAEMTFKDPGQNAVGFEIDACLATASGRIACANDQAPALR
jgi:predicted Zn finger-like uncharacterized protein